MVYHCFPLVKCSYFESRPHFQTHPWVWLLISSKWHTNTGQHTSPLSIRRASIVWFRYSIIFEVSLPFCCPEHWRVLWLVEISVQNWGLLSLLSHTPLSYPYCLLQFDWRQNDDRPSNSWLFLWLSTPPSDIFRCRSHGFSNMLRLLSVDLPSGDLVIEPLDGFCYGWEFWKNRKPWPLHHQIIEESYQLSIIIPIQWSGYCNIPYGSKYFLRRDKNHPECSLTNAQKLGKSHLLLLSNQLCSPKEEGKHVIVLSCH